MLQIAFFHPNGAWLCSLRNLPSSDRRKGKLDILLHRASAESRPIYYCPTPTR